MKDNVELHLEKGAELKAMPDISNYYNTFTDDGNLNTQQMYEGRPVKVFIYAKEQKNISITGEGIINGNGCSFIRFSNQYHDTGDNNPRPTTIYFENCSHVSIKAITIKEIQSQRLRTHEIKDK